jgi:hypothetical protein
MREVLTMNTKKDFEATARIIRAVKAAGVIMRHETGKPRDFNLDNFCKYVKGIKHEVIA